MGRPALSFFWVDDCEVQEEEGGEEEEEEEEREEGEERGRRGTKRGRREERRRGERHDEDKTEDAEGEEREEGIHSQNKSTDKATLAPRYAVYPSFFVLSLSVALSLHAAGSWLYGISPLHLKNARHPRGSAGLSLIETGSDGDRAPSPSTEHASRHAGSAWP